MSNGTLNNYLSASEASNSSSLASTSAQYDQYSLHLNAEDYISNSFDTSDNLISYKEVSSCK